MRQVLQRLGTVPGVLASAFFSPDGSCVTAHGGSLADEEALIGAGSVVLDAFSKDVSRHLASAEAAIFRFEQGHLVVKRLRGNALIVLCRPGTDLSTGGAGFHITVAARLLALHSSRVPGHASTTMPVVRELDQAEPALRAARVPRV